MAKRKKSVALFEVIQKDKRFAGRGGVLPAPSWMDKSQALTPVPAPKLVHTPPQPPASAVTRQPSPPSASFSEAVLGGRAQGPFTPTSIAIIAAAVVLVIGAVVGIRMMHRAASGVATAQTIQQGPAHPDVMNVAPAGGDGSEMPVTVVAPPASDGMQAGGAAQAGATQSPVRQENLQYVRIKLYETEETANAKRDLLVQHGIACTVEHGAPNVPLGFAIIGTQAFAAAGTAEYSDYIVKIKGILAAAGDTHPLAPRLIPWRTAKETTSAN
jgi:hypothetical protein